MSFKSILDSSFKYTPAALTDIRETFRRHRKLMQQAPQAKNLRVLQLPAHSSGEEQGPSKSQVAGSIPAGQAIRRSKT